MIPRNWWTLIQSRNNKIKGTKVLERICEYLAQLYSYPASSGTIERIFSTFGFVWSLIRNRLGTEKAQKLFRIHRFMLVYYASLRVETLNGTKRIFDFLV